MSLSTIGDGAIEIGATETSSQPCWHSWLTSSGRECPVVDAAYNSMNLVQGAGTKVTSSSHSICVTLDYQQALTSL